jgi:hypothetical protein
VKLFAQPQFFPTSKVSKVEMKHCTPSEMWRQQGFESVRCNVWVSAIRSYFLIVWRFDGFTVEKKVAVGALKMLSSKLWSRCCWEEVWLQPRDRCCIFRTGLLGDTSCSALWLVDRYYISILHDVCCFGIKRSGDHEEDSVSKGICYFSSDLCVL